MAPPPPRWLKKAIVRAEHPLRLLEFYEKYHFLVPKERVARGELLSD